MFRTATRFKHQRSDYEDFHLVRRLPLQANMAKRMPDLLVERFAGAGVRRIYGASGDSLNGITDSIGARATSNGFT